MQKQILTAESGRVTPTGESMRLVVREVGVEADGVRSYRFEDQYERDLPAWEPGAHLEFVLPSGLTRHYSLCGALEDTAGYTIAVLDQPAGRGGSREFHDSVVAGSEIQVRGPRNHFPLVDAASYLFIAGGIGITPILPMARAVLAAGKSLRVLYGGRAAATMAFVDDVQSLDCDVKVVAEEMGGRLDIAAELEISPEGTRVYCCGPEPLLRAAEVACSEHRNIEAFHYERFGAASRPADGLSGVAAGGRLESFEIELAATGKVLVVGPGESILDRVLEVVPRWPWACREGFCGSCETRVLAGAPFHADVVLTPEERESNAVMMICVGGSCSERLALDI